MIDVVSKTIEVYRTAEDGTRYAIDAVIYASGKISVRPKANSAGDRFLFKRSAPDVVIMIAKLIQEAADYAENCGVD